MQVGKQREKIKASGETESEDQASGEAQSEDQCKWGNRERRSRQVGKQRVTIKAGGDDDVTIFIKLWLQEVISLC